MINKPIVRTYCLYKVYDSCKNSAFCDGNFDDGLDSDPHWFGSLDPHNQCGSTTLQKRQLVNTLKRMVVPAPLKNYIKGEGVCAIF